MGARSRFSPSGTIPIGVTTAVASASAHSHERSSGNAAIAAATIACAEATFFRRLPMIISAVTASW
jgi:hypothetical protein